LRIAKGVWAREGNLPNLAHQLRGRQATVRVRGHIGSLCPLSSTEHGGIARDHQAHESLPVERAGEDRVHVWRWLGVGDGWSDERIARNEEETDDSPTLGEPIFVNHGDPSQSRRVLGRTAMMDGSRASRGRRLVETSQPGVDQMANVRRDLKSETPSIAHDGPKGRAMVAR
jgi:hypothetical protein